MADEASHHSGGASGASIAGEVSGPPPDRPVAPPAESGPGAVRDPKERVRSQPKHWSGLPLAASLALVAFAVIFGIYGPKVVDRSNPPIGIPVSELAEATAERHLERLQQLGISSEKPIALADAESGAATILGESVRLPDLSSLGFEAYSSRPATVPGGGRAAIVTYGRTNAVKPSFLSLLIVPDREQYVVYSPFGKPTFLPSWEIYPVETADTGFGHAQALVWTDGSVVRVLHSGDRFALEASQSAVIESSREKAAETARSVEGPSDDSGVPSSDDR